MQNAKKHKTKFKSFFHFYEIVFDHEYEIFQTKIQLKTNQTRNHYEIFFEKF